jgi:hypothetical protein
MITLPNHDVDEELEYKRIIEQLFKYQGISEMCPKDIYHGN